MPKTVETSSSILAEAAKAWTLPLLAVSALIAAGVGVANHYDQPKRGTYFAEAFCMAGGEVVVVSNVVTNPLQRRTDGSYVIKLACRNNGKLVGLLDLRDSNTAPHSSRTLPADAAGVPLEIEYVQQRSWLQPFPPAPRLSRQAAPTYEAAQSLLIEGLNVRTTEITVSVPII